jgi:argininosuccinate lyase
MIKDEELIYNLKMGEREALELLFFSVEKRMQKILNKYSYFFKTYNYDKEDVRQLLRNSTMNAINTYCVEKGKFFQYCIFAFQSEIARVARENYLDFENQKLCQLEDSEIENFPALGESQPTSLVTLSTTLDDIRDIGEKEYDIIVLLVKGYSYEEIGDQLNIDKKQVSNKIEKVRRYMKSKND